jgi:hypothetical protein
MNKKNLLFFFTKKRILLIFSVLMLAFFSCKEKPESPVDQTTLPMANFYFDNIQYKIIDGQTYAFVKAYNGSQFSNRWKWHRPGSYEIYSGAVTLETESDSAVTTAYLVLDQVQRFSITLTAYSRVVTDTGIDTTFVSLPLTREIVIKKP